MELFPAACTQSSPGDEHQFNLMSTNLPKPIPLPDLTSRANPRWNIPSPALCRFLMNQLCPILIEKGNRMQNISPSGIWSLWIFSSFKWNRNKWINGTFLLQHRATRNPDSLSGLEEEYFYLFVVFFHPCSWKDFWSHWTSCHRVTLLYSGSSRSLQTKKCLL